MTFFYVFYCTKFWGVFLLIRVQRALKIALILMNMILWKNQVPQIVLLHTPIQLIYPLMLLLTLLLLTLNIILVLISLIPFLLTGLICVCVWDNFFGILLERPACVHIQINLVCILKRHLFDYCWLFIRGVERSLLKFIAFQCIFGIYKHWSCGCVDIH